MNVTHGVNKPGEGEEGLSFDQIYSAGTDSNLLATLGEGEVSEESGTYLDLYHKQNEASKALEQRAKEHNITDIDGKELHFSPDKLEFDGNAIIYKPNILRDFPRLFIRENGIFREVPLLSDKIRYSTDHSGESIIPETIKKIKDGYYLVNLAHCQNGGMISRGIVHGVNLGYREESYVVDKEGNIIEQVGKLGNIEDDDRIYIREPYKNNWGFWQVVTEEYNYKGEKKSENTVIFDDNMNKLFTIDSQRYVLYYCDNQVCVCQDIKEIGNYMLTANGTIDVLKDNEYTEGFNKYSEEEDKRHKEQEKENDRLRELPFETRYSEVNHCVIKYGGDNKVYIENDEGAKLREIGNVLENNYMSKDEPHFMTNTGSIKIKYRTKESNILYIQESQGGNIVKSVFINKKEPEKKLELIGFAGSCSVTTGKLVNVVGEKATEIYDENLNKLGVQLLGLYGVSFIYGEDKKVYLYSTHTGDKICEVKSGMLNDKTVKEYKDYLQNVVIKRDYTDKNNKTHLIVEKVDGTLIEVVPNPDKPEKKETQNDEFKS